MIIDFSQQISDKDYVSFFEKCIICNKYCASRMEFTITGDKMPDNFNYRFLCEQHLITSLILSSNSWLRLYLIKNNSNNPFDLKGESSLFFCRSGVMFRSGMDAEFVSNQHIFSKEELLTIYNQYKLLI